MLLGLNLVAARLMLTRALLEGVLAELSDGSLLQDSQGYYLALSMLDNFTSALLDSGDFLSTEQGEYLALDST